MKERLDFGNILIQYWVDEFPQMPKVPSSTEREFYAGSQDLGAVSAGRVCVELFYRYRHHNYYGLLGLEFKPEDEPAGLELEINYTDENTEHYQSEISKYDDMIYCGLTREYVPDIKRGIMDKIQKLNGFSHGSIVVSCGANSEIGSSPWIFETVSGIAVEFFYRMQQDKAVDLTECFKSTLVSCGIITEA